MDNKYQRSFLKDTTIASAGSILIALKGVILLPILIKNLGVALYGAYTLIIYGIAFLLIISSFGVGFQFKRYMPSAEDNETRRELFYPQFIFSFLSALVISAICILIQTIFFITNALDRFYA